MVICGIFYKLIRNERTTLNIVKIRNKKHGSTFEYIVVNTGHFLIDESLLGVLLVGFKCERQQTTQ